MTDRVSNAPPGTIAPEKRDAGFLRGVESRRVALREELAALSSWEEGPAVLEIGCGHGHFLTAYAAAHPGTFCVGIDLLRGRLERARRKAEAARAENVRFVRADAAEFLAELPPAAVFDRVFVLFPDPWPKRRHHKNRLLQAAFLQELATRTTEKAELFFRTDHLPYFQQVAAELARNNVWRCAEPLPWPFETTTVFQAKAPRHESLRAVKR